MKTYRLKPDHPLHKRLSAVFDEMDRQGVRFDIVGNRIVVNDLRAEPGSITRDIEMVDLEDSDQPVYDLPPTLEYKLVKDV